VLPHDISARNLEAAIESFATVPEVRVERTEVPDIVNSDGSITL